MQKVGNVRRCPRCRKVYTGYPALSRTDNTTEICSQCGVEEAFAVFLGWQFADRGKTRNEH